MKRVLLINPAASTFAVEPPNGLGSIAGTLLQDGHIVKCKDFSAKHCGYTEESLFSLLESFQPDIIGVSIFTVHATYAYSLFKSIRSFANDLLIVSGGPHVTASPGEAIEHGCDVEVYGEGEITMQEIVAGKDLRIIKGIGFKDSKGKLVQNAKRDFIVDLDSLADPVYDVFNLSDYEFRKEHKLLTSRGCPSSCTFCASITQGKPYRYISAEKTYDSMLDRYKNHGIKYFVFDDDTCTANYNRLKKLHSLITKGDVKFGFVINSKIRFPKKEEVLPMLADMGCKAISYGCDGGTEETLRNIKKGIKLHHIKETLKLTKEAGINVRANFIMGYPWETEEHLHATFKFIKSLKPWVDNFTCNAVPIPYPGTELYNVYHEKFRFTKYWLDPKYSVHNKQDNAEFKRYGRYVMMETQKKMLNLGWWNHSDAQQKIILDTVELCLKHSWKRRRWSDRFFVGSYCYLSKALSQISGRLERKTMSLINNILVSTKIMSKIRRFV